MKIAIFGDLSHVRSFGAQLTSECLRADALHYFKSGNEIKFFPMPSVGIGKSRLVDLKHLLPKSVRKTIRNIRANNAHTTSKNIYSNVHYTTEYDNCIPNKLEEFISLKTANYDSSPLLKNLGEIIAWADFILINGEGNIVNHEGPDDKNYRIGARILLTVAAIAAAHHKKFSLINCTIEPKHSEFEKVLKYYLPKCEYVTVREPVSYDYCTQKLQLKNVLQGVDASMGYCSENARFSGPTSSTSRTIVIGDSSGLRGSSLEIREAYEKVFKFFIKCNWNVKFLDCTTPYSHVLGQLSNELGIEWLSDHYLDYAGLQQKLAEVDMVFSGRWHPSILAISCGTPISLFGADSCKTAGLAKFLGAPFYEGSIYEIAQNPSILKDIALNADTSERKVYLEKVEQLSSLRWNNFHSLV